MQINIYAYQYICISRPRRFGKNVMANMLATFFNKNTDSGDVFDSFKISQYDEYSKYLNKHEVIYIDFSEVPDGCSTYREYITRIATGLKSDLIQRYSELELDNNKAVWDVLSEILDKTNGQQFIFIIDEWDAVFHMSFITDKDKDEYLLFLKSLLKSKAYVELAYMTGILPIAKYSSGSELNMFAEFQMTTMELFSEYFGFTDDEVDSLYNRYLNLQKNPKITRVGLREWYDGYRIISGKHLYNPRSVVFAFQYNQLSDYWTSSGPYDEIFYPKKKNGDCIILELKIDKTPDEAIEQIKEKKYALKFKGKLGEEREYTGRVIAVGIGYSKETKEHQCRVEELIS